MTETHLASAQPFLPTPKKGKTMQTSPLVYIPCYSLPEAEFLLAAQQRYRADDPAVLATDGHDDTADRIITALKAAPLPTIYGEYLRVLLDADDYLDIRAIATKLNISPTQIGAMASKLSARLKKVATATELRDLKTPLNMLVSIRYDQGSKEASHQLTDPAGRTAAQRFLGM
ncbi:hypothetical protein [Sphingobium yanoikuyae]|uniref:hypothetical protein n=1 Tax=Sphingobium yanoikuyae TaxID=13690 RepID=UPI001377DE78|nr:hypothetical protein [Sphingobium yanoikuyae]NBB42440.1 hypothetical protein [Sphingobium yanoikuyae]